MPLYEYHCTQCNHRFEKLLRSAASAEEAECPSCGGNIVNRLPSTFATRFGVAANTSSCAPSFGAG